MLCCQQVTFGYPGSRRPVLRELSFSLAPGELCALLGSNGSGKSSLCRLLSGLYLPSSGWVWVDELSTASPQHAPALRRLLQLVTHDPQAQTLGDTVVEDVAFGLANFGFDGAALEARLRWALDAFDLSALRDRSVHSLSGGELQLARLAGAVALRPRYLLLDEGLAMLDAPTRRRVLERLRGLQAELSMGVLLATHELEDLAWADRVCWLEDGRLVLDAPTPLALETILRLSNAPFEPPAVLLAAHRLREAGWRLPLAFHPEPFVESLCAL